MIRSAGYRSRAHWVTENLFLVPLAAALAGVLAYWALVVDRLPPIELTNGRVIPSAVSPGETISTEWDLKRLRSGACSAVLSREIVDGRGKVSRMAEQVIRDVVFPDDAMIGKTTPIPYDAQYGPATYRLIGCYRCSGLSLTQMFPVCVRWPELPFSIVPPK